MRLLPSASRNAMLVWPHKPKMTSTPSRSRYSASKYDEIRVSMLVAVVSATVFISLQRISVDDGRFQPSHAPDYALAVCLSGGCNRTATVTTYLLDGGSARVRSSDYPTVNPCAASSFSAIESSRSRTFLIPRRDRAKWSSP